MFFIAVTIISLCAGFFTGLLGVGGGIILFPAFLYILPVFGFEPLSMSLITGIAAVQILAGSFFGFLDHRKDKKSLLENNSLVFISLSTAIGTLCGSVFSVFFLEKVLLSIYFLILLMALSSMTILKPNQSIEEKNFLNPNKLFVFPLFFLAGSLAGSIGVGGAVLYIPILRHFYKKTTKTSIASVTVIVFAGALMTFLGKVLTAQVPYELVIFTLVGSFFGAKIGVKVSHMLSSLTLKKILVTIIIVAAIRVLISIVLH